MRVNPKETTWLWMAKIGSGLLIVHSAAGGPRVLALRNGRRIETQLPAACTWVFDSETGEKLL